MCWLSVEETQLFIPLLSPSTEGVHWDLNLAATCQEMTVFQDWQTETQKSKNDDFGVP